MDELWTVWAKAEDSNPNGECLEWRWLKSSYSGGPNSDCVEARQRGTVQVRDTKDRGGPVLQFTPAAWRVFTGGLKHAEPGSGS